MPWRPNAEKQPSVKKGPNVEKTDNKHEESQLIASLSQMTSNLQRRHRQLVAKLSRRQLLNMTKFVTVSDVFVKSSLISEFNDGGSNAPLTRLICTV